MVNWSTVNVAEHSLADYEIWWLKMSEIIGQLSATVRERRNGTYWKSQSPIPT